MVSVERPKGGPHFEYVVSKLEAAGARYYNGEDWFCPSHDDGNRGSLGISELPNGSLIMFCQGGCSNKAIFKAAGLEYPADFYPRKKRERYVYRDEDGTILYCVDRYYKDGKKRLAHRVYAPDHEKADAKGFAVYPKCMAGVPRVLYRLPMVRKAIAAGKSIYVCAGEKDAKAMHMAYRVAATTASAGESSKWDARYTEQLRGAQRVYVVADRDTAGEKRAAHVYDALVSEGFDVQILFPAVDRAKADAADHIAEGYGLADFVPVERADITTPISLLEFRNSDAGNAERLVAVFGRDIRYIHKHKIWVVWDGTRWVEDEPAVFRMVVQVARMLYDEVAREMEGGEISESREAWLKQIKSFAVASENSHRVESCLKSTRVMDGIATYPRDYDADPMLLNVLNGTIDLRTGTFRPHDRSDMLRKVAPVAYDAEATCETWLRFTGRVQPSKPVRRLLRALSGYVLTGDTGESILPVFYGKGSNGKSTFTRVLSRLLGDYSKSLPQRTLLEKNGESIPNDIAMLEGARLSLASEFKDNARIDEALIKAITGGDEITARFLGKEYFRFQAQVKIVLSTNHKPEIRGADDGIWRRMVLIPWLEKIEDDEKDLDLAEKLWDERSGILNWCLSGLRDMTAAGGLRKLIPRGVAEANQEYREESDFIGQFIEERAEMGLGEEFWESSQDLYAAFRDWMEDSGNKPWTKITFGRALSGRPGIEPKKRGKSGVRGFSGIKLKLGSK